MKKISLSDVSKVLRQGADFLDSMKDLGDRLAETLTETKKEIETRLETKDNHKN